MENVITMKRQEILTCGSAKTAKERQKECVIKEGDRRNCNKRRKSNKKDNN